MDLITVAIFSVLLAIAVLIVVRSTIIIVNTTYNALSRYYDDVRAVVVEATESQLHTYYRANLDSSDVFIDFFYPLSLGQA